MRSARDQNVEDFIGHCNLAIEFFHKGLAKIDGDPAQASEKLYKSVEESVKALAIYYDLRDVLDRVRDRGRWSVRDLEDAVVRLSKILADGSPAPSGASYHLSRAPHGCGITTQTPPSAWGDVGSSPAKLAHTQHQEPIYQKAYKNSLHPEERSFQ